MIRSFACVDRRRRVRARVGIEPLEARVALSGDAAMVILTPDRVLEILGSNENDHVRIRHRGSDRIVVDVKTDGRQVDHEVLARSSVETIAFNGGPGNDRFVNRTSIPGIVNGGPGNDVIIGGRRAKVLFGGSGNDRIVAKWGATVLVGGAGNDRIRVKHHAVILTGGDGTASNSGQNIVSGHSGSKINPNAPAVVTVPITSQASQFAAFVNSLNVVENWRPAIAVNWQTGQPVNGYQVSPSDTHCSAFAAAVASDVGLYLLQPPQHDPMLDYYKGQAFLANAQSFWLNRCYDPNNSSDPSPSDEMINAHVVTSVQAGWANVASQLPANASAYDLSLEAQNLANKGYLVVASVLGNQGYTPGQNAPPPRGPGHIAVIMPANLTRSQLTNLGPAEAQAGAVNYNLTNIAIGFQRHLADPRSFLQSIGASTSVAAPRIQFFYNTNPMNVPAG